MLKRFGSIVVAAASLAACSESTVPTLPDGTSLVPVTAQQTVLTELSCRVDVSAQQISCAPASAAKVPGRSSDLILGGQNQYVKLTSTNVVPNGTISLSADLTVQNLTGQPWGTTDGVTPTGTGVRVFFYTGPTNGVTVANPTNTATFTAPAQPYFEYSGGLLSGDGILQPGETSGSINWQFNLNGQATFAFQLLISTAMPVEQGVLRWARTSEGSSDYFNAVWGSSASDVWAAGQAGTLSRWNGSSWTSYPSATLPLPATQDVNAIWGSSASNVVAVGGGGEIQRFNGTTWNLEVNGGVGLYGLWGTGAGDIWAVGISGTVLHYNGTSWSVWATNIGATPNLAAVWGTATNNVYAVGGTAMWRYTASSGSDWQVIDVSAANPGNQQLRAIWGASATDIWVSGTNGFLMRGSGSSWTQQTSLGTSTITSLWGSGANDVYAVNEDGQIWHWNGAVWVALNNSDAAFNAVWGTGTQNVWVVGANAAYSSNAVLHGTR
jgi:hypothetical protein